MGKSSHMPLLPALRLTDDVDEVEADTESWVHKIRDAIEHEDYLAAHDTWPVTFRSKDRVLMNKEDQDEWERWQGQYADVTDVITGLPGALEESEVRALASVTEVIKIHRKGFQVTDQAKDRASTCSQRLNLAITTLEQYAIVR